MMKEKKFMLKFLIGIGCGVGLGLLIAPAPGKESRKQLLQMARYPRETAQRKVQEVREEIAQMGADLGRQVAEKAVDKVIPEGLNKEPGRRPA
jgi:gas vesicle protein